MGPVTGDSGESLYRRMLSVNGKRVGSSGCPGEHLIADCMAGLRLEPVADLIGMRICSTWQFGAHPIQFGKKSNRLPSLKCLRP